VLKFDRCRQCGAKIVWAQHHLSGKRAPLDATPVRENYGNIFLHEDQKTYQVLESEVAQNAWDRGFELYTNHLGTCPARERRREENEGAYEHATN
jgi:hypothetical protein